MMTGFGKGFEVWSAAVTNGKSAGRGSNGKTSAYGVKKLRELILELAVRGKLVPQEPADEPASVLLEKIEAEKTRWISDGRVRKQPVLPEVSDEEKPFQEPNGWVWTRLGSIAFINPRNDADDQLLASFVPMPLVSTSHTGEHGHELREWGSIKAGFTHFADGDIGLAKITPCFENSKAAVFANLKNGIGAGTTELHVARPYGDTLNPRYILIYLKAPEFLLVGASKMTGTAGQKRVPKDFFAGNPLPLPPLAEQHRIVAKVDELMALCDALEAEQSDSMAAHERLVACLFGTLTAARDAFDFNAAWRRIADHFDTLFTTENSIDQLKQCILQLAVMGKLVPQDPADEPASNLLLELVPLKRDQASAEGIRNRAPVAEDTFKTLCYPIPESWERIIFDDVLVIVSGVTKGRKLNDKKILELPYLRVANVQRGFTVLDNVKTIEIPENEFTKYRLVHGDVLMTEGGDWDKVGRAAVWKEEIPDCIHQNHVYRVRSPKPNRLLPDWLVLWANSLECRGYFERASKQTTNLASINMTQLRGCPLLLPPTSEQHRIVAKVDELMALCEALKARLGEARTTQAHLADAVVARAMA